MKNRLLLFLLILSSFSIPAYAQMGGGSAAGRGGAMAAGGSITGRILDAQSGQPIEYANVVLFGGKDSSQLTGAVSDPQGRFTITPVRPGRYYIDVSFMGYEKKRVGGIQVKPGSSAADIGDVGIQQKGVTMDNVVVEGQRVPFSYKIDKKVINVDKLGTTVSGSAADVLSNVPSVTVDIEGNVSLRGSGSFTVLIDGRPTILDAQEALQQVPASQIEDIEIITNPSAKYDPEGVAGIINVVLKKNKNIGISGLSNINGGLRDKYGADALVEVKTSGITTLLGVDYNKRSFGGDNTEQKYSTYQGNTSYINSDGDFKHQRNMYGLRGNVTINLGDADVLGLGGRAGHREMQGHSTTNRLEYSTLQPLQFSQINRSNSNHGGNFYSLSMNYQHKFPAKGHELTADASYEYHNGDESSLSELFNAGAIVDGKKTVESGPSKEYNLKADYTLPLGENEKFETGFEGETELSDEFAGFYEYNTATGVYDFMPQYSNSTKSANTQYSLYSTYSGSIGGFGYQAGFRAEYTYRNMKLLTLGNRFSIDRWDYFPTVHLSYRFASGEQIMASYTRRIQRPRNWFLEPFETWVDANTIRKGNPSLLPELIDSYELGFQKLINKVSLSTELYYRVNNNKIEGVRSVYSDNVTLQTFDNIGADYSLGTEIMLSMEAYKFWNIDLMGNIYDYRVKGQLNGEDVDKSSFNWTTRLNNQFKLTETFQFQINAGYNSPTVSSQSKTKGNFTTDLAVRKDLFEKSLTLTLQVRDLLGTGRWESTTQTAGFYSSGVFKRESPMVMLNLRYTINNFKQRRDRSSDNGGDYGEEGGGF